MNNRRRSCTSRASRSSRTSRASRRRSSDPNLTRNRLISNLTENRLTTKLPSSASNSIRVHLHHLRTSRANSHSRGRSRRCQGRRRARDPNLTNNRLATKISNCASSSRCVVNLLLFSLQFLVRSLTHFLCRIARHYARRMSFDRSRRKSASIFPC